MYRDASVETSDVPMYRDTAVETSDVPMYRDDTAANDAYRLRDSLYLQNMSEDGHRIVVNSLSDIDIIPEMDDTVIYDFDNDDRDVNIQDYSTKGSRTKRKVKKPAYLCDYVE